MAGPVARLTFGAAHFLRASSPQTTQIFGRFPSDAPPKIDGDSSASAVICLATSATAFFFGFRDFLPIAFTDTY